MAGFSQRQVTRRPGINRKTVKVKHPVICRTVRRDNTIICDSNRYSLPLDTCTVQPEVRIETLEAICEIGRASCRERVFITV